MAPGDHRGTGASGAGSGGGAGAERGAGGGSGAGGVVDGVVEGGADGDTYWVQWHQLYEDSASNLSMRLRTVQAMLHAALDEAPGEADGGPIRIVSLCAGQGRDVIDVVATHPRGPDVSALLVELDPALVAFARSRAAELGVAARVRVVQGDASQCGSYAGAVPADVVLVCGVFGNISPADMTRTIEAMPSFCAPGGQVIWTRHRRPPDRTPAVRADFAAAGFTERGYEAPDGTVFAVGRHRLDGATAPFDPDFQLFTFVGDGWNPA